MNYYRLTFNRITIPNPDREPLNRHWDWYDVICVAKNRTEAVDHGQHIAMDHGVKFVDAIKLLRVVGAAQINREPAFQKLP
jgi:hypothetical protein